MTDQQGRKRQRKISRAFAARLGHLGGREKVRAIVMLQHGGGGTAEGKRQSAEERRAAIESIRTSAGAAMDEIDAILARFDGRRLADRPDAFGAVAVEATAAGIYALAASDAVRSILEDQSLHLTLW